MATRKPSTTRKTGSKNVAPGEGAAISKTKVRVNLEGVSARARKAVRVSEGDYLMRVTSAEVVKVKSKGENFGKAQVKWQFIIEEGKHRGVGPFYYYTGLWNSSIWSFRGVLQSLKPKVKIPETTADLDLTKYLNKFVAATLVDDEYTNDEGRTTLKSAVDDVFHPDLLTEDEEEDDEEEDSDESDEDDEEEDLDEEEEDLDEEEDEEDEEPEEEDDDDVDLDEEDL